MFVSSEVGGLAFGRRTSSLRSRFTLVYAILYLPLWRKIPRSDCGRLRGWVVELSDLLIPCYDRVHCLESIVKRSYGRVFETQPLYKSLSMNESRSTRMFARIRSQALCFFHPTDRSSLSVYCVRTSCRLSPSHISVSTNNTLSIRISARIWNAVREPTKVECSG